MIKAASIDTHVNMSWVRKHIWEREECCIVKGSEKMLLECRE